MNNITLPIPTTSSSRMPEPTPSTGSFRTPHFDSESLPDALKLVVFVPGVHPNEVEITTRGSDLTVMARKAHHVRANWKSMHMEGVQRDYLLNLRLGRSLNFKALQAELRDDALTITIPKKEAAVTGIRPEGLRVA